MEMLFFMICYYLLITMIILEQTKTQNLKSLMKYLQKWIMKKKLSDKSEPKKQEMMNLT